MKAVAFRRDGRVELVSVRVPDLRPNQIAIQTRFAGINPTDTYHRERVSMGSDDIEVIPGVEVAGEVMAVGSRVSRWSPGDRVLGLVQHGGLSSVVVADEDLVIRMPENLSDQEAAATPEAFITAHDALRQGKLAANETLLVTGATGNVGQAAVKIGLTRGAHVFGLARSKGGVRLLQGLGAAGVLAPSSRERIHSPELVNSVDVVVELVGACNARPNLVALRPAGRIVQIGARGNENITFNLRDFKTKRAVMIGSTLRRRPRAAKVSAVCAFSEEVLPLLASGAIAPRICRIFPAEEAEQAFEFMNIPAKYGKVMIAF